MVKTELVVVQYGERGNHLCLCHVESELTVGPWVNGWVHGSTDLDGSRGSVYVTHHPLTDDCVKLQEQFH